MGLKVTPSILSADFSCLREEIKQVDNADELHFDVMDGHFVPNLTMGPWLVKCLRVHSHLPFQVHLMVENPRIFFKPFADALRKGDLIIFHAEAVKNPSQAIELSKQLHATGLRAGIALNPSTPAQKIEKILGEFDFVLVMSVNPGFAGQAFISSVLPKISELRRAIDSSGLKTEIGVDGGVNLENARECVTAGANNLIAATSVFKAKNPRLAVEELKKLAK